MPTPDIAFNNLKAIIESLEATFITPALASRALRTLSKPELLYLSAYVVLAHAAFEEYFEELATWALDAAVEDWRHGKVRQAAAALLLHHGKPSPVDEDTSPAGAYDRVREELERLKTPFSRFIVKDNHGISLKYLKKLFYPLGVDMPSSVRMMGSLDTFAGLRGAAAHTATRGAKKHKDPGDTTKIVNDCLDLAEEMKRRVLAIR